MLVAGFILSQGCAALATGCQQLHQLLMPCFKPWFQAKQAPGGLDAVRELALLQGGAGQAAKPF